MDYEFGDAYSMADGAETVTCIPEQIEGEAHFIFSGQVVRGDMFFANPSLKKAQLRVPQLLQLGQEHGYDPAA